MVAEPKQQFNIYLSNKLIRMLKHAAIDADKSLSAFVEEILETHLKSGRANKPRRNRE